MKTYCIEFISSLKIGSDEEENTIREIPARHGYQVGSFDNKARTLEIDANIKPGTRFAFQSHLLEIVDEAF